MTLNGLAFAEVQLKTYSLTHLLFYHIIVVVFIIILSTVDCSATATTTSAASQMQPSSNVYAPGTSAAPQLSPLPQPVQAMDVSLTEEDRDVADAVSGSDGVYCCFC